MKCVELNPAGNFDPWEPEKINELQRKKISESVGELIFENDDLRLWDISLWPKERLPFRRQNNTYSWTSLTDGLAVSRYVNGQITLIHFKKGDTNFVEFPKNNAINDLENIGDNILKINVLEYKSAIYLKKVM
ncbi:MAG: hypothetical protein AAFO99_06425 [Bacteroidota bacterium]